MQYPEYPEHAANNRGLKSYDLIRALYSVETPTPGVQVPEALAYIKRQIRENLNGNRHGEPQPEDTDTAI